MEWWCQLTIMKPEPKLLSRKYLLSNIKRIVRELYVKSKSSHVSVMKTSLTFEILLELQPKIK